MDSDVQDSSPRLLELSPETRRRIYNYAGLVRDTEFVLCGYAKRHDLYNPNKLYSPEDVRTSYNLFLTCRRFNTEITAAFFSKNQFLFRPRTIECMSSLLALRPFTLQHLTSLTVQLNVTSCLMHPVWESCCKSGSPNPADSKDHDDSITSLTTQQREFFRRWCETLAHILTHVTPNRLHLYLVCDVEGYEAASLAIQSLHEVDHLAACAIRFGRQRDRHLQSLARDTVLRVIRQLPDPKQSFRYLDLPPELRRKILENTDLVTPLCEVEWNPRNGFLVRHSHLEERIDYFDEWPESLENPDWGQYLRCSHRLSQGCFCVRYHSAFTLTCKCWQPPQPLFMVCRSMRDEAEAVFYSKNRIVITPVDGFFKEPKKNPDRFEASLLFNNLRPVAFQNLRFLEIVFPPFEEGYCAADSAIHTDWKAAVHHIEDNLCLRNLTLRITMANYLDHEMDVPFFRANLTREQGLDMWWTYHRILLPFRSWVDHGLKRFYLRLTYPWHWTRKTRRKMWKVHGDITYLGLEVLRTETSLIEGYMRDMVMGRENVARLDQGREAVDDSQWLAQLAREDYSYLPRNPVLWYPS